MSAPDTPTTGNLFDTDEPDDKGRRLLIVFASSRFHAACRSCGEPMTMCKLVGSEKWMPFNADPVALKTSHDSATRQLVEYLDPADVHFRSCPGAAAHRSTR